MVSTGAPVPSGAPAAALEPGVELFASCDAGGRRRLFVPDSRVLCDENAALRAAEPARIRLSWIDSSS